MIGHLRGRLLDKRVNQVLVDVGGVGYLVHIPLSTFYRLGELHDEVTLLTHTHVREDVFALYGFLTSREKHFFELLISASGVGPALALKILSGMSVEEIVPAIRHANIEHLTRIPGVGGKTAERIVVELRDKLEASRGSKPLRRPGLRASPRTWFRLCSTWATTAAPRGKPWRRSRPTARAPTLKPCCAPRCSA